MTNRVTKDFLTGVNEILTSTNEQDLLFQSLRQYRSDDDLDSLVSALHALVVSPDRLGLFDAVRPLIPAQHQLQFDRKTHRLASRLRVRVVSLSLRQGPLGFAFRGGLEHGVGCFVSAVVPKSAAAEAGLRPGDEVLRVNGFPVARATHEEVAALIGARPDLKLKVKRVGMLPERRKASDPVSWEFSTGTCFDGDSTTSIDDLEDGDGSGVEELNLFLNARGSSLGCTIVSGPPQHPGIFVHSVTSGGLAEQAGLREGDQLVQVNGVAFGADISHSHAVMVLKSPAGVHMTIRRGEGLDFLAQRKQQTKSPQRTPQRPQQLSASEVQVHVTRQRGGEQSPSKSLSSAGTVTPKNEEGHNANVFFRTRTGEQQQQQQQPEPENALGPHNFSSREAGGRFVESLRLSSRGGPEHGGCGLQLEEVPGGQIAVAGVDYGSLAFKADVRLGDYLLAIDDNRISGYRLPQVAKLLQRAEQKTEFVLTLARAPAGIFNDEITYF